MRVRVAVAIMTVLLLLYVLLAGQRALVLLTSAEPVAIAMGVALLVLPLLALWAIGRELWFGVRAQQLGDRLDAEGGLPDDDLPVRPSGRIERDDWVRQAEALAKGGEAEYIRVFGKKPR